MLIILNIASLSSLRTHRDETQNFGNYAFELGTKTSSWHNHYVSGELNFTSQLESSRRACVVIRRHGVKKQKSIALACVSSWQIELGRSLLFVWWCETLPALQIALRSSSNAWRCCFLACFRLCTVHRKCFHEKRDKFLSNSICFAFVSQFTALWQRMPTMMFLKQSLRDCDWKQKSFLQQQKIILSSLLIRRNTNDT